MWKVPIKCSDVAAQRIRNKIGYMNTEFFKQWLIGHGWYKGALHSLFWRSRWLHPSIQLVNMEKSQIVPREMSLFCFFWLLIHANQWRMCFCRCALEAKPFLFFLDYDCLNATRHMLISSKYYFYIFRGSLNERALSLWRTSVFVESPTTVHASSALNCTLVPLHSVLELLTAMELVVLVEVMVVLEVGLAPSIPARPTEKASSALVGS